MMNPETDLATSLAVSTVSHDTVCARNDKQSESPIMAAIATKETALAALGLALLVLWGCWWASSLHRDKLASGHRTWIPCWHWLGCDFEHNYYAARVWLAGGDPYESFPKRLAGMTDKYVYPPVVLACFAWCGLLDTQPAFLVWLSVLAGIAVLGGLAAWRTRRALDLAKVPLLLVFAAVLLSYPILFEMERGNCNLLVLLFVVAGAWALRREGLAADVVTGLCLAVAAWIKMYPGLLILGVLALRRWRAAGIFVVVALAIGLSDVPATLHFARNLKEASNIYPDKYGHFFRWSHTLAGSWQIQWAGTRLTWLTRLPGTAAWACLVLPLALWVSRRIYKNPGASRLVVPYLLWLAAAGSFLPVSANDYSLVFLPPAALAVWDRRDGVIVHVLMAFTLLWWQPLSWPVEAQFLWYCKLSGLVGVAFSLINRAREQEQSTGVLSIVRTEALAPMRSLAA